METLNYITYFQTTRIAISFQTKAQHEALQQYFNRPDPAAWARSGICSFYIETVQQGPWQRQSLYRCSTEETFFKNYTIITFAEFQWLTNPVDITPLITTKTK